MKNLVILLAMILFLLLESECAFTLCALKAVQYKNTVKIIARLD